MTTMTRPLTRARSLKGRKKTGFQARASGWQDWRNDGSVRKRRSRFGDEIGVSTEEPRRLGAAACDVVFVGAPVHRAAIADAAIRLRRLDQGGGARCQRHSPTPVLVAPRSSCSPSGPPLSRRLLSSRDESQWGKCERERGNCGTGPAHGWQGWRCWPVAAAASTCERRRVSSSVKVLEQHQQHRQPQRQGRGTLPAHLCTTGLVEDWPLKTPYCSSGARGPPHSRSFPRHKCRSGRCPLCAPALEHATVSTRLQPQLIELLI